MPEPLEHAGIPHEVTLHDGGRGEGFEEIRGQGGAHIVAITEAFHEVELRSRRERTGGAVDLRIDDVVPLDFSVGQAAGVVAGDLLAVDDLAGAIG